MSRCEKKCDKEEKKLTKWDINLSFEARTSDNEYDAHSLVHAVTEMLDDTITLDEFKCTKVHVSRDDY